MAQPTAPASRFSMTPEQIDTFDRIANRIHNAAALATLLSEHDDMTGTFAAAVEGIGQHLYSIASDLRDMTAPTDAGDA